MFNIYQLFLMNNKMLPFSISRNSWGNLSITVDKVENIRYSAKAWYCDAFTISEKYKDFGYGKAGYYKMIGCAGCYQWQFADINKMHDENLLPDKTPKHDRGLTYQKGNKNYKCFYCEKKIKKGENYERYRVRSAGNKNLEINEAFCVGHRDEMREKYFKKPIDEIKFRELIDVWDNNIII